MSRKIDFSKPLSEEDRDYVRARPWLYRGRKFEDLEFEEEDLDDEDLDDSDEDDDSEDQDLDSDDEDEEDEEDDPDLEDLTVAQLRDLAKAEGISAPKKATKDDLIGLLSE